MNWKIAEDKGSKQFFLIVWDLNSLADCVYKVINDPEIKKEVDKLKNCVLDYNNALFGENDNGKYHVFYYLNPVL